MRCWFLRDVRGHYVRVGGDEFTRRRLARRDLGVRRCFLHRDVRRGAAQRVRWTFVALNPHDDGDESEDRGAHSDLHRTGHSKTSDRGERGLRMGVWDQQREARTTVPADLAFQSLTQQFESALLARLRGGTRDPESTGDLVERAILVEAQQHDVA
jgi:hypothetical protein